MGFFAVGDGDGSSRGRLLADTHAAPLESETAVVGPLSAMSDCESGGRPKRSRLAVARFSAESFGSGLAKRPASATARCAAQTCTAPPPERPAQSARTLRSHLDQTLHTQVPLERERLCSVRKVDLARR